MPAWFCTSNLSLLRPDCKRPWQPLDVCRSCELWKTDWKCLNSVAQNQDARYQQLLLKIRTESTLEKLAKTAGFKSSWELILRPVRSCGIDGHHAHHLIPSRPWRMFHHLLNFLKAEEGCPTFRVPGTLRTGYGGYSLGKDLCLLRSTLKHIVGDILSPIWSKLSDCRVEPWEDEPAQSVSAVFCRLLVLVCLFCTVQPRNVVLSVTSVLLWPRLVQSRLVLVWFNQIVYTHKSHQQFYVTL